MSLRTLLFWLSAPLVNRPQWRRAAAVILAGIVAAVMAIGSLQFLLIQFQDRGAGRYLPDGVIEAFRVLDVPPWVRARPGRSTKTGSRSHRWCVRYTAMTMPSSWR